MAPIRLALIPTLVAFILWLAGCATPVEETDDFSGGDWIGERVKAAKKRTGSASEPAARSIAALQSRLGMNRRPSDLGYAERAFSPCRYGMSNACANQYLSVVHFQLLCRDSEGTVSSIPNLTPIASPNIVWNLAGQSGGTPTDRHGYGQLTLVTDKPVRNNRLILRKGAHYVGVSVDDVSKLILPRDWCAGPD